MSDAPTAEITDTELDSELSQVEPSVVEDVLVEEVSIDGMCGVY